MPLDPEEFDKLVPPWKDAKPWLSADDVIDRLDREVRAAASTAQARSAAIGLIVAVGNYEWLAEARAPVLQKANQLLDEFDPEHSWRWG